MSVEFHYYQPWSYAGDCTYDYWGDAYKDAGKIPAENEKTMTDFFDKAVNTWSNKGLGIVIGEWGVTDHYKSNSEKVHENMTYYCKFFDYGGSQTRLLYFRLGQQPLRQRL